MTPKQSALLILCAARLAADSPEPFGSQIRKMVKEVGAELVSSGIKPPEDWIDDMTRILKEQG